MGGEIYITPEGYEKLKKEKKKLLRKKEEVARKVQAARVEGDLSENAAYQSAKEEQKLLLSRLEEVEGVLRQAEVVKKNHGSETVAIGSKVRVERDGEKRNLHVVGAWEAEPDEGKISYQSPLGRVLLGKKVGEVVQVKAPAGTISWRILAVK